MEYEILLLFLMLSATVFILNRCLKILSKTTIHAQKFMLPSKLQLSMWVISLYIRPQRDKHLEYTHQHAIQMNKLVYIHHLHALQIPVCCRLCPKPLIWNKSFFIWNLFFSFLKRKVLYLFYATSQTEPTDSFTSGDDLE